MSFTIAEQEKGHQNEVPPIVIGKLSISPLKESDLEDLLPFCEKEIGAGYYNKESLFELLCLSYHKGFVCSFVGRDIETNKVGAVRLTTIAGSMDTTQKGHTPEEWRVHPLEVGYFKSMFLAAEYQGSGIGGQISRLSLEKLKLQGAKAVLSHCSLSSPNGSSRRYLQKMGFTPVQEHEGFWADIDYLCAHCYKKPCTCKALEMILYL